MKNSIIVLVIVLALALAGPVMAQNGEENTLRATVIVDAIRLRYGPSTEYPVGGEAAQGDILTVDGRNAESDWVRVVPRIGPPLWAAAFLVNIAGSIENLPVYPPPADGDYALIVPPGCDYFNIGPFVGTTGQPVFLVQGWEAASLELVQSYLDNVVQIVTFDDRIIGTYPAYATDIFYNEERETWQVFWEFRMGPISAGTHHLEWAQLFDRVITDGLDNDGDGQDDTYGPEPTSYGCTIQIVE